MPQFVKYLGAIMKHLKGVVVAVVGSVLFASPSWVRAALSPDWQRRMDLLLTVDVNTVRNAYLIFIPIGLFWATYKAWQEENNKRLEAEKASPEALKNRVEELAKALEETKTQQRRELTPKQRIALKSAIETIQTQHGANSLRFPIAYNHMVGEAGEFAGQLYEVLFPCGVSYESPVPTDDVPLDFEGLALVVKDRDSPPVRAKLFMTALQEAELPVRFETLTGRRATLNVPDEYCEFVVGRRESIGAIERQLAKLQVQQDARWQSLSEQQRADFVAALKELPIDRGGPNVMIFPDFTHHDAVELSHTFGRLCAEANWNAPTFSHAIGTGPDCPPGINIYAKPERPDVQVFVKALERAKIPYQMRAEHMVDVFEVRIGRRIA
jgi:hypothetical protein